MNKFIVGLFKKISLLIFVFLVGLLIYINLPFVLLKNNTCIFIHTQESFHEFVNDITKKTHYVSPTILKVYSRLTQLDRHLEAGEYCFSNHASLFSIMKKIGRAGRELHKFTVVEGWTYQELSEHLTAAPSLSRIEILQNKKAISNALHIEEFPNNLEGQFYPATYYYAYPDTALDVLQQAHMLMIQRLQTLYKEPQTHEFYKNTYELLIAASIIQKETDNPIEQMLVASVLVNRMKQHMKLQMDPTVIYGLRKINLKKQDLKTESIYNTYLHSGLPPTPICMPGETALYAAAHPKDSKYLYYVSKKDGFHQFSETLTEQNKAIKKYLLSTSISNKND